MITVALVLSGCSKSLEQQFELGVEKTNEGNYSEAIQIFSRIVEEDKDLLLDPIAAQANYQLAQVHLNFLNEYSAGYKELQKVAYNYEHTEFGEKAKLEIYNFPQWLMNKAEVERDGKNMKEAIHILQILTEHFSSSDLAPKAQYLIGDIYNNDLSVFEMAIQAYRLVIVNFPGSSQEPHAQFMIAYIYANYLNQFESARKEYQVFLDTYPKHELTPSVRFEMEFLGRDINEIPTLKRIAS